MNHSSTLPGGLRQPLRWQSIRKGWRNALRWVFSVANIARVLARPTVSHGQSAFQPARRSPAALLLIVLAHLGLLIVLASGHSLSVPTLPTPLSMNVMHIAMSTPKVPPRVESKPKITANTPDTPQTPAKTLAQPAPARLAPALPSSASPMAAPESATLEPGTATAVIAAPMPATPPAPVQSVVAPRFDIDYLDNPAPNYPPISRRNREAGRVLLHVFVEASGLPGKIEVRTSSGYERLDKSAIAAVSRWKFLPARQGKDAVAAWVLVPIDFSLQE